MTYFSRQSQLRKFDPEEARDDHGMWTSGGGSAGSPEAAKLDATLNPHDGSMNIGDHAKPLLPALNTICASMCARLFPGGYDTGDPAPNTFEDLVKHYSDTGRMLVWSGASDATVFDGDTKANYAFRAWHDYCHLRGLHKFDEQGEQGALDEMVSDVRKYYGASPMADAAVRVLTEEVMGQVAYYKAHSGEFPANQRAFAEAYLADPAKAAQQTFKGAGPCYGRMRDKAAGTQHDPFSAQAVDLSRRLRAKDEAIRKYSPDQARDEHGRFSSMGGTEMASPNETPHPVDERAAMLRLRSPEFRTFQGRSEMLHDYVGAHPTSTLGALGDTREWGTEESLLHHFSNHTTAGEIQNAAALDGLLGNQKAVISFKSGPGADTYYEMSVARGPSLQALRQRLDQAGLDFRTIVPRSDGGYTVAIIDQGSSAKTDRAVSEVTHDYGAQTHYWRGTATTIGADGGEEARPKARAIYEEHLRGASQSDPRVARAWGLVRTWRPSYPDPGVAAA